MIRIRNKDGSVNEHPDSKFVEICDPNGDIITLVYQHGDGEIHIVEPGDDQADRYSKLFKVKFIEKIIRLK